MTGLIIALAIAFNIAGIGMVATEHHAKKLQQQNYELEKQLSHFKKPFQPSKLSGLELHGIKVRNLEKSDVKQK